MEDSDDDDVKVFHTVAGDDASPSSTHFAKYPDLDVEKIGIFSVHVPKFTTNSCVLNGACVDSGAQSTVIGEKQAHAYCALVGTSWNAVSRGNGKLFRFGKNDHVRLGTLCVRLPVREDVVVPIKDSVVPIDVPLLIRLDVLHGLKLIIEFDNEEMYDPRNDWSITVTFKLGHLYLEWPPSVCYT